MHPRNISVCLWRFRVVTFLVGFFLSFSSSAQGIPCPKPAISGDPSSTVQTPSQPTTEESFVEGVRLETLVIQAWPCEETPDDGYWTWLVHNVLEKELFQQRLDEISKDLEGYAAQIEDLRGQWMRRLKLELEYEEGPGAEGPRMKAEVLSNNARKRRELISQTNVLKDEQKKLIDEALGLHRSLLERTKAQLEKSGDRRKGLADEVQRLEDQEWFLTVELYDAAKWYGEHELIKLMKEFDFNKWDIPDITLWFQARTYLADADNLDRRIWLQQTSPTPNPPDVPLIMAARTQRLKATVALRRLVQQYPNHQKGRERLRELELYWLKQVANKLDRERKISLAAFQEYLTGRGFNVNDRYNNWDGFTEFLATYFGLGPIALTAGLPGIDVPGALAESVGTIQMSAAQNLVALNIMIRLVKNGLPLTELPKMTPKQLAETIILNTKMESPLPEAQSRRMVREVKEAFAELGVLNALVSDDPFNFVQDVNQEFGNSFYLPIDGAYHWYELVGDIMSLRNIAAFFSANTVLTKVNGRWLPGFVNPKQVTALREAGKWVMARDRVASYLAPRLANLSTRLSDYRLMAYIQKRLASSPNLVLALEKMGEAGAAHSSRMVQGLSWLGVKGMQAGLGTTKFAALMLLWGGAHHLAAESGIPGAVLLVDLIMEFEVPHQLRAAFIERGVELNRVARRLEGLAEEIARRQREIEIANKAMDEIMDVNRQLKSPPPPARTVQGAGPSSVDPFAETISQRIDELAETVSAKSGIVHNIPQNTDDAIEHALGGSVSAMRSGDVAELERATTAAQTLNQRAVERLKTVSQKVEKAREKVSQALVLESGAGVPGRGAPGSGVAAGGLEVGAGARVPGKGMGGVANLRTIGEESEKALQPFFDSAQYTGDSGSVIRQADEALLNNKLDEALELYQDAQRLELELGATNTARLAYLQEKVGVILNAQQSRRLFELARTVAPETEAMLPILEDEAEWVLEQFRKGHYTQISGGANPLFEVKDESGRRLLVKKLGSLDDLEAEVAVPVLAKELGLNTPAARGLRQPDIKVTYQENIGGRMLTQSDQPLEYAIIMRPVDDFIELGAMHEFDLLAVKSDYAAQRTLKAWVADSDGHMRNVLFDRQGRMWIIDHDMGNVTSSTLRQAGSIPYTNDPKNLIEATVTFPQGKIPESADEVLAEFWRARYGPQMVKHPLYGRMSRFDQLIHYQDMAPTVEKIQSLNMSTIQDKLMEAGFSEGRAKAIVRELEKRRSALEPALNSERLFGGPGPMQLGSILHWLHGLRDKLAWQGHGRPFGWPRTPAIHQGIDASKACLKAGPQPVQSVFLLEEAA